MVLPPNHAKRSVAVRERDRIVTDATHVPGSIRPEPCECLSLRLTPRQGDKPPLGFFGIPFFHAFNELFGGLFR